MELNASKSRKKSRRRSRDLPVDYILEILEWDWRFSFGMYELPDRDGPYYDFRHLQLQGTLIRPTAIRSSDVGFTLLPDRRINEGERDKNVWKSLGSVNRHRGNVSGLLSVPMDVMPCVLQMLAAHRFRYLSMTGERLRYGHASIRSYRLEKGIDPEDMPPE